jgi:hypothetical protein
MLPFEDAKDRGAVSRDGRTFTCVRGDTVTFPHRLQSESDTNWGRARQRTLALAPPQPLHQPQQLGQARALEGATA